MITKIYPVFDTSLYSLIFRNTVAEGQHDVVL